MGKNQIKYLKPIGRQFGFWTLLLGGFGMSLEDQPTGAAICIVGAVLFDAIKTMDKGS